MDEGRRLPPDEDLTAQAKMIAESSGISEAEATRWLLSLSPRTRRFIGIARRPGERAPTDEEVKEAYLDHLARKYR